jgi:hydroxyethylthiazole kinase-like uncharacterized protein yjeF
MKQPRRAAKRLAPIPVDAELLRQWPLPDMDGALGKVGRGQVLVVGGSVQNPGAVMLAGISALRAGAGRLQLATAAAVAPLVAVSVPEARVIGLVHGPDGELLASACRALRAEMAACDALLVGPGMMAGRAAAALLRAHFNGSSPAALVVDAGGLPAYVAHVEKRSGDGQGALGKPAILTPHAGEMAKMCGVGRDAVQSDPLDMAHRAALRYQAVIVLKGAETYVAAPDGRVFVNTAGGLGLGTSGSGDALAGLVAGLAARGTEALQAAVWAVHLHALAGDRLARKLGPLGFLARELSGEIPVLLSELEHQMTLPRA